VKDSSAVTDARPPFPPFDLDSTLAGAQAAEYNHLPIKVTLHRTRPGVA
jgi:hypothetical protein